MLDVERLALEIFADVESMKERGLLPRDLKDFGDLHSHFDANVGWSAEIDALPTEVWAAVQQRVSELL